MIRITAAAGRLWLFASLYLLFEKKQKVLFIFLAQEKGTKRTSTPTKASPYIGRMKTENCRNRQFSVGLGKPGLGLSLLLFTSCEVYDEEYQ